jgi:S1-C subfamily serine protease
MLSIKYLVPKIIGSILLSSLAVTPALAKLTPAQINSIARQTTVLISPGLTQDRLEELANNRRKYIIYQGSINPAPDGIGWTVGSGVIINKQRGQKYNYKYQVLTVAHNFDKEDLDSKIPYGIRTRDNKVHSVKEEKLNDKKECPKDFEETPVTPLIRVTNLFLIRFGCKFKEGYNSKVEGFDLAVISFESDEEYTVAPLGDSSQVKKGDKVYVSGWPNPEKEYNPEDGKCSGKVQRRQRRLAWVIVTGKIDSNLKKSENGYSIFYTDQTRPGMSGGPVFDVNGRVVGVHGRGPKKKEKLIGDENCSIPFNNGLESEDINNQGIMISNSNSANLKYQYSSAQSVNSFLDLIEQANIPLSFSTQPLPPGVIEADLTPISDDIIQQDIGVFDDPDDVIENIYEKFRLHFVESAIKSQPSGACWSLLLGENFCND